ncbi:MAG: hypothetical protein LBT44_05535 [Clostridiales bacterium]|nr:hypothetical protein [Clostridiales bacterium]
MSRTFNVTGVEKPGYVDADLGLRGEKTAHNPKAMAAVPTVKICLSQFPAAATWAQVAHVPFAPF